jgi:fructokinase
LRKPYYSQEILELLLPKADIVKLNDDELAIVSSWYQKGGNEAEQMKFLREKYQSDVLILTKGDQGAACLDESGYHVHPGFTVKVEDTIGSGDAFLAAFLNKLLTGADSAECLEFACALGALSATKKGGTPSLTQLEIEEFQKQHI